MPEQRSPEVTPNGREFLKPDSKTRVIWFGHQMLSTTGDPHGRVTGHQCHVMVLSHNHYDHLSSENDSP